MNLKRGRAVDIIMLRNPKFSCGKDSSTKPNVVDLYASRCDDTRIARDWRAEYLRLRENGYLGDQAPATLDDVNLETFVRCFNCADLRKGVLNSVFSCFSLDLEHFSESSGNDL